MASAKNTPAPAADPAVTGDQTQTADTNTGGADALPMGADLLTAIGAAMGAEPGYLFITQGQAGSVDPLHITINTGLVDGEKAAAILTDAGKAAIAPPVTAAAPASGGYTITADIPMPSGRASGGRKQGYPFDLLEVGQSFHVAKTAENPNPAERLASSVTGARAKYAVPMVDNFNQPVMETVTVTDYQKDANTKGGFAKGADGKRVIIGTRQVTRQKMKETRDFVVGSVDGKDPQGEGARVWRKL